MFKSNGKHIATNYRQILEKEKHKWKMVVQMLQLHTFWSKMAREKTNKQNDFLKIKQKKNTELKQPKEVIEKKQLKGKKYRKISCKTLKWHLTNEYGQRKE